MSAPQAKILSQAPTELELQVAQAFSELENSSPELKAELRPLQFKSIREIDVASGKKALAIFVPVPSLAAYHKVQTKLTRELEKKFPDRHVVFLAERRILPKPSRRSRQTQKRPRSRTLTAVHDKVLEDSKDVQQVDYKLESFQAVYNKLSGKQIVFEIPGETH